MATPRELLDRLDTRHDELIHKLDELNAEIEATLAQFAKSRTEETPSPATVADSTSRGIMPGRSAASTRRAA